MTSAPHVIVVGAGIAGLATAYRLAHHHGLRVSLVERDHRVGGKIHTEHIDGYVIEGGPDAFLSWKPRATALCDELGLTTVGSNDQARRAFIMRAGRLQPLPDGIAGVIPRRFLPTLRSPILSPLGKARLMMEWAVPRRGDEPEQSLAAFVRRRTGRETWERLVEPLVTGIYAGDGERLAVRSTFPMLLDAERDHGSLIRAGIAARRAGKKPPPGSMFLTTADGLGGIVTALVAAMGERVTIHTGTTITQIRRSDGEWVAVDDTGAQHVADAVVLATPAAATGQVLATLDAQLARELAEIPMASVATVSVVYDDDAVTAPINGHGYVNPRSEGSPLVGISLTSTKFPVRARPNSMLIRAHVGRMGEADPCTLSDDELIGLVQQELVRTLGVRAEPKLARVFRWPQAIPQYNVGHRDRVTRIRERLTHLPGIAVAGATWRGIGIPDCISSGDEAADAVMAHLATRARS